MNILVTGGTGFIGQALIAQMKKTYTDATITIISRTPEQFEHLNKTPIIIRKDVDAQLIEQQDIVINLAGEPIAEKRWSLQQKELICNSRWQITEKISTLIVNAKTPPSLYISASAIGFYGRQTSVAIDENHQDVFQEFSHEICHKWEDLALKASSKNTRVCLLRTGIVLDKNHGALAKMLLPFKLGLGGTFASGKQMMSWIHINDMVMAILHIIEQPKLAGPINMTAPNAVNNRVFSRTLAQVLSRPCLLNTPHFVLKCLFGEMADLFIYGQNVTPKKLLDSGYKFQFPSLKPALENLLA